MEKRDASNETISGFAEDVDLKSRSTWRKKKRSLPITEPSRARRPNTISREKFKLELSEEDVLAAANLHENFVRGQIVLTKLPKFDDTTHYGINANKEKDLLRLEIRRLIKDVTSVAPLLFDSDKILGSTTPEAYRIISNVADQIVCNLSVICHDNQLILFENCRQSGALAEAAKLFRTTRGSLRKRFQPNDKVKPREPEHIKPEADNMKVYFALVDYITSTVARVLLHLATSKSWRDSTLAILSRWSVKLKALIFNPAEYTLQALSDGEGIIQQLNTSEDRESVRVLRIIGRDDKDVAEDVAFGLHEETDATQLYYSFCASYRHYLHSIVSSATLSLHSNKAFMTQPSTFEVCSLVYETGHSRSLTMLAGDRAGDVCATSDKGYIHYSHTAMKMLCDNMEALKKKQSPSSTDERAVIKWQWSEGRKEQRTQEKTFETSQADDMVSILPLLSLSNPYITRKMIDIITLITITSEEEDPILQFEQKHFQAKFVITTADYIGRQQRVDERNGSFTDPEVVPVSGNILSKRIRAGTKLGLDLPNDNPEVLKNTANTTRSIADLKATKQYQRDEKLMRDWIFTTSSVTVKCRGYVAAVLAVCSIILGGGIAIPYCVKERITGVDPFQLTTFAWLVVGVTLIIAKGRYVTEWPWHDFLHGRVVCKSISDLADVTGIDAQMILNKLLYNEIETFIVTKGPYNGMFLRRLEVPETEGFSIDVPTLLSTLLASGFIVLKVLSLHGEHLIVLDVRKGTGLDYAVHEGMNTEYTCVDLGKQDLEGNEEDVPPDIPKVLYLIHGKVTYTKVLGLYVCNSSFG
ncbi:hypothetical protein DL98DRAFT_662021 [Cadophora sp. DSE1049]|nr:hypothetical protein DL98DRAFT_662021 [Cadophora sp. DSE1049]